MRFQAYTEKQFFQRFARIISSTSKGGTLRSDIALDNRSKNCISDVPNKQIGISMWLCVCMTLFVFVHVRCLHLFVRIWYTDILCLRDWSILKSFLSSCSPKLMVLCVRAVCVRVRLCGGVCVCVCVCVCVWACVSEITRGCAEWLAFLVKWVAKPRNLEETTRYRPNRPQIRTIAHPYTSHCLKVDFFVF